MSKKKETVMSWEEAKKDLEKPSPWWTEVYYWIYRLLLKIEGFPREIKWFFQRARKGFAECDVWELSHYLASVIAGSVKRLKEIQHGIPGEIWTKDKTEKQAMKEWNEILDKIIDSFGSLRDIDVIADVEPFNPEKSLKIIKKIEKEALVGQELFLKYFGNLWD